MGLLDLLGLQTAPSKKSIDEFRVVAIISLYDDEVYLERCFENMISNGIEIFVIDNDANETTMDIVKRYRGCGVCAVVKHPRSGCFDWSAIVAHKEEIANQLNCDWVMLWDSDEIREPPPGFATIKEALMHVEAEGYNTVAFDEFVFVPTSPSEDYVGVDYVQDLETYYYFSKPRLNAWRRQRRPARVAKYAGHRVAFRGQRVFPTNFVLRHYLFLSLQHGMDKYLTRTYSREDKQKGWSKERTLLTPDRFHLPDPKKMKRKSAFADWDKSNPRAQHPVFIYSD